MFLAFDHHVVPCLKVVFKVKIEFIHDSFSKLVDNPHLITCWLACLYVCPPSFFVLKRKLVDPHVVPNVAKLGGHVPLMKCTVHLAMYGSECMFKFGNKLNCPQRSWIRELDID